GLGGGECVGKRAPATSIIDPARRARTPGISAPRPARGRQRGCEREASATGTRAPRWRRAGRWGDEARLFLFTPSPEILPPACRRLWRLFPHPPSAAPQLEAQGCPLTPAGRPAPPPPVRACAIPRPRARPPRSARA